MPVQEEDTSPSVEQERSVPPLGVREINATNLRGFIAKRFNEEELRNLCVDLKQKLHVMEVNHDANSYKNIEIEPEELDYETLTGIGKEAKARELVGFVERHAGEQGLQMLANALKWRRPLVWQEWFGEKTKSSLPPPEDTHQFSSKVSIEELSENKSFFPSQATSTPLEDQTPEPESLKTEDRLSGSSEETSPSSEGQTPLINTPSVSPPAPSQSLVPNRWGRVMVVLIGLDVVLILYLFWYWFGYDAAVLAYVQAAASVLALFVAVLLAIVRWPNQSWQEIVNWLSTGRWLRSGVIVTSVILVALFITTLIPSPLPPPSPPEIIIPAGPFWMGSDDEYPDASPLHQVYVETFWIDKYEVTNEKYKKFIDATGYPVPHLGNDTLSSSYDWDQIARTFPAGRAKHPVVLVSWKDARAYCQWAGKRLPTEAEWEKAARGTDRRRYPWGNNWDFTLSNTSEGGRDETAPAGNYRGTSFYGVMDMAGNVWEWTADSYQPYPGSNYWNGRFGERLRVLRGGSFRSNGQAGQIIYPEGDKSSSYGTVTTAYRLAAISDDKLEEFGFRCVRSETEVVITPTPTETPTAPYTPPTPTPTPWVLTNTNTLPYADSNQLCSIAATKFPDPVRPDAIMISFGTSTEGSWCIWEVRLNGFNASKRTFLSFWVRGEQGGEQFEVGLKDSVTAPGDEPKIKQKASNKWRQVFISLQEMQSIKQQKLTELDNFSLGFTHQLGSGIIYVQGFAFEP
jgi:formylglycine-generating enzyme required for sulfatase activity